MKSFVLALAPCLLAASLAAADPPPREEVVAYLEKMRATQKGMMNVNAAEGEFLSQMVRKVAAKRVLEIGTSNGYSGIWIALGLRETGGKLLTLEIDEERHALAQKNFAAAGVNTLIESKLTDALKELAALQGPFDMVFIDAWKPDYGRYLDMVLPMVRPGGVIMAHNTKSQPREMEPFLKAITTNPALKTEFVAPGPGGFSISVKQ